MTATALVGVTLIDGRGAPPLPDSAVVCEEGRVSWVGLTIEPGKRADPVVLDGDPLADVEKLVDRERLPEHPVLTREG